MTLQLRLLITVSGLLLLQNLLFSQEQKKSPFANGEPIGIVFANFHTGINQGNNPSAFEIRRVYLGYKFKLNKNFTTKIQLDIGSPDDVSEYSLLRRFAYFKNAYLQYKSGKFTVRFGIIPLQQFKIQENIWGHRYIYKTIVDEHGLGSSADLGTSVNYKVNPWLEMDLTLMNGEGYSKLQTDFSYKTGFGITVKPWKGLILRCYADAIQKSELVVLLVNFIGYEIPNKFSAGVEYDLKFNNGFEQDQNIDAFSAYMSYNVHKKVQLFGRYDFLNSNIIENDLQPWHLEDDGSTIIAGIQYQPIKQVKLSLNYQDWVPWAQNLDSEAYIFLNTKFSVW